MDCHWVLWLAILSSPSMACILPCSASPEVQPNPPQFFEDCPAHNVTNGFLVSPMSPCSGLTHAAQSEHARIPAYSGAGNPIYRYANMEWHVSAASRRTTDQSENYLPFKLEDWKQPPVYWRSNVIRHQHETCKVPAGCSVPAGQQYCQCTQWTLVLFDSR